MDRGFVHVYTGNGKGKTTAALGLALRAAGAGLHVFIAQFAKGMDYSELRSIQLLGSHVTLRQYGMGHFIRDTPVSEDLHAAMHGLTDVRRAIASGRYDLIVLDEANIGTLFWLYTATSFETEAANGAYYFFAVSGSGMVSVYIQIGRASCRERV